MRKLFTVVLFTFLANFLFAEANYVYHERTTNGPGCGSDNYVSKLVPNSSDAVTIAFKVEFQNYWNQARIYYTIDGSTPAGSFGTGTGTTMVVNATYSCGFFEPGRPANTEVVVGTIPAQADGTTIKYIVSAWHSVGGDEIFGNGCGNCGTENSSSGDATVFTYTVPVLPVELTSFAAKPEPRAVALTWTTSSEENNAGFEVQKSVNGKNFETIGFVEGNGTSLEINAYNFIDESPVSGVNYYRLKQNDFDGTFGYSDILTVNFDAKATATIYPNPTTEKLTIATETQGEVNIRIFNMKGQVVYQNSKRVDNQLEINLDELAKGNYILQVKNLENQAVIYKGTFVKQ